MSTMFYNDVFKNAYQLNPKTKCYQIDVVISLRKMEDTLEIAKVTEINYSSTNETLPDFAYFMLYTLLIDTANNALDHLEQLKIEEKLQALKQLTYVFIAKHGVTLDIAEIFKTIHRFRSDIINKEVAYAKEATECFYTTTCQRILGDKDKLLKRMEEVLLDDVFSISRTLATFSLK